LAEPNYRFLIFLLGWVTLQVLVIILQDSYGPRFFIPNIVSNNVRTLTQWKDLRVINLILNYYFIGVHNDKIVPTSAL
jgi:hypothetical protein